MIYILINLNILFIPYLKLNYKLSIYILQSNYIF